MNQLFKTLALLLVGGSFSLAQSGPQLLILSPNETKFAPALDKELSKKVNEYKKSLDLNEADAFLLSSEFKARPENVQTMSRSEVEFLHTLDHKNLVSYLAEQFISYTLYDRFENVVVKLKDVKSNGSVAALQKVAADEKMMFVLNFSSVELYKEKKESFARITIQLYDQGSGTILLNKAYTGGWNNPGLEYACEDHSVNCCINNALSQVVREVSRAVIANDPSVKMKKQLEKERAEVLSGTYLKQPFDKKALQQIIPASEKRIEINTAYQVLFSSDQTKFVAFFIERLPADANMEFVNKKDDKRKNILTENQMDFFNGKIPNTYAHIVKGVKHEGKWYYEKAEVTYFNAANIEEGKRVFFNNLQEWSFFAENSSAVNPGFWESTGKSGRTLKAKTLFEKVTDITKDPEWEKNKEMWASNAQEDRPYIGLYEIVATQLMDEREASDKLKHQAITDRYINPVTEKLQKKYETAQIKPASRDHVLIYPTDERAILCPVKVKESGKDEVLLYVVLVKQPDNTYKTYEWTYLRQIDFKNTKSGPDLIDQLNTVTRWNYAYTRLDDDKFWNERVLLKSGGSYQFLKAL